MCVNDSWENNIIKEKVYCPPSISLGEWRHERAKVNIGKKKKKKKYLVSKFIYVPRGKRFLYMHIYIYMEKEKKDI